MIYCLENGIEPDNLSINKTFILILNLINLTSPILLDTGYQSVSNMTHYTTVNWVFF